jgi:hydrogenase-4 component B
MPAVEHAAQLIKTTRSLLPLLAILTPLAGGLAVLLTGRLNERLRNIIAIAFSAGAFAFCAAMFPRIINDGYNLTLNLDLFFGHLLLKVDSLGLVFALFASFIWLASTVYAYSYIQHEERRTRYHVFSLLTEAACLGIFLAGDFFALFVFFELMGFLAYMLVVHNQTYEARKAGVKYIFMTVYGGLSLLFGILLYLSYSGGLGFTANHNSAYLTTSICFVVTGFMMAGFGVKAGMVPLHVWLPLAHPAAPSPASALLSGVMIKAGAYGFFRIVQTLSVPASGEGAHLAPLAKHAEAAGEALPHLEGSLHYLHNLGFVIIWLAVLTMVVGMVLALVQDNVKRLLAYSSISQMGFILLGIGVAAYLGPEGGMGLAGALYHVVNHAFFKGLLFLGVGAVYYATHQLDMTRLGGLYRKMPFTTLFTCIGGLGIMGMLEFNGFVSKTLLHDAELEALHLGGAWLRAVDIIFVVTAGGTICYIAKLLALTFFGHHRGEADHEIKEAPLPMLLAMGTLAGGVLFLGEFPGLVMRKAIIPALRVFMDLTPESVHHLEKMAIYNKSSALAFIPPLAIGIIIFLVMRRWDLFRLRLPETLGVDYYYSRTEVGFLRLCIQGSKRYAELRATYYPLAKSYSEYLYDWWQATRKRYRDARRAFFNRASTIPIDIAGFTSYIRAKQFAGEVSYGVIVIVVVIVALALTLL